MRHLGRLLLVLLVASICSAITFSLPSMSRSARLRNTKADVPSNDDKKDDILPTSSSVVPLHRTNSLAGLSLFGGSKTAIFDTIRASKRLSWTVLFIAIGIEIFSTTLLTFAQKEGSLAKTGVAVFLYSVSLLTFSLTLAQIDVGIAYAVWSACGTAFVSALGVMLFGERMDLYKISCLGIIILGVIGLNLREVVVRR